MRQIRLCFSTRVLATDEKSLKRVCEILKDLEDKGFIKEGILTFEESRSGEVKEILDRLDKTL